MAQPPNPSEITIDKTEAPPRSPPDSDQSSHGSNHYPGFDRRFLWWLWGEKDPELDERYRGRDHRRFLGDSSKTKESRVSHLQAVDNSAVEDNFNFTRASS